MSAGSAAIKNIADCIVIKGKRANAVVEKTAVSPQKTGRLRRDKKYGITLLPTLLAFVSIASVLTMLQAREMAQMRVMGRLIEAQREALSVSALHVLVTGEIAAGMLGNEAGSPALDGTPIPKSFDGKTWSVTLQDVEGLVDLYISPPAVLSRAGLDTHRILKGRAELVQSQTTGRFASLSQSIAFFGVPTELRSMVTQAARSGQMRLRTAPQELRGKMRGLTENQMQGGQVRTVRVNVGAFPDE